MKLGSQIRYHIQTRGEDGSQVANEIVSVERDNSSKEGTSQELAQVQEMELTNTQRGFQAIEVKLGLRLQTYMLTCKYKYHKLSIFPSSSGKIPPIEVTYYGQESKS